MGLIIKSKTDGDLTLITTSNDLHIKTQTVNDLIITIKDIPITLVGIIFGGVPSSVFADTIFGGVPSSTFTDTINGGTP